MLKESLKAAWWSDSLHQAGGNAARRAAARRSPTRIERPGPPVAWTPGNRDNAGRPTAQSLMERRHRQPATEVPR